MNANTQGEFPSTPEEALAFIREMEEIHGLWIGMTFRSARIVSMVVIEA
jgi:hypothetical protein